MLNDNTFNRIFIIIIYNSICCLIARSIAPSSAAGTPSQQQFLISPITGERVPSDKLEEHMKHGKKKKEKEKRQHMYCVCMYSISLICACYLYMYM